MEQIISSCLGIVFSLYGYNTIDQHDKFIDLLELAGNEVPKQYIAESCPKYKEYEAHDWLINATQAMFYARQGQERWNQKIPAWISENPVAVIEDGKQLGVLDRTSPVESNFECAALFGSTVPHMQLLMKDFKNRVESEEIKLDKVFLLTGERYAVPKLDGGEKYVMKLAEKYKLEATQVTEAMLMKDLYEKISLNTKILNKIPFELVDVPKGSKAKPNTIDTIERFLANLQPNECKTVLYVSRAPYKIGQEEDVKKIMYLQSPQRKFEVIGGGAKITEVPSKDSAAYHITMAIAGQLYGGFEMIAKEINAKYNACSSIEYLTEYKAKHFSKTHKVTSNKKVELHDVKIN